MAIDVEPVEVNQTDSDLARCHVVTENATGEVREYDISLTTDDTFDDGFLLAGRRVDSGLDREHLGIGPSPAAWDAAREHFRERGFEVHG